MEIIKFKTNLKCSGCIATVAPSLNAIEGLKKWEVDISGPDKVMLAEVESGSVAGIILMAFREAGFEASAL